MKKDKGLIFGIDNSIFLLLSIIAFVFVFPIIDNEVIHDYFATISYTLVLLSVFSIIGSRTKLLKYLVIVAVSTNFLLFFVDSNYFRVFTFSINTITFTIATSVLIRYIAISKNVTVATVVQAISGYFLIGIIGVILNSIVLVFNENAIALPAEASQFSTVIYYSFITITTIGYGEITPQCEIARTISVFIGVSGQIYLTVVIAMIIGKFLSARK